MYVIVTDCEYRMSIPVIRDLGKAGYKVVCVSTKRPEYSLGSRSRYAYSSRTIELDDAFASGTGEDVYSDRLDSLCKELTEDGKPPVVFPVGKFTLYALSLYPLKHGLYLVSPTQILDKANDKHTVLELAKSIGINVPDSYPVGEDQPPEDVASHISYPCVIKYNNGEALGLKADKRYTVARNEREFASTYVAMRDKQSSPLVQQYIPGDGYGFSCIFDEGEVIDYICHRRIREYPVSGGPSTCCVSVDIKFIKEASVKLLRALGFKGIAMVEFKGSPEGGFYLMEINPRVWGSFALTRCARSSFSQSYVKHCCGLPVTHTKTPYKVGAKMVYRTSDAAACLSYFKTGKIRKASAAVFDILNPCVRDGVIEMTDLKPLMAYIKSKQ